MHSRSIDRSIWRSAQLRGQVHGQHRQILLHLDFLGPPPHPLLPNPRNKVWLLSGGQFLLASYRGELRCWSVADNRLIWQYTDPRPRSHVSGFAAEVVDEGRAVVIVIGSHMNQDPFLMFVEVVRLDLLHETPHSILLCDIPYMASTDPSFLSCTTVCGDFAVVQYFTKHADPEHMGRGPIFGHKAEPLACTSLNNKGILQREGSN